MRTLNAYYMAGNLTAFILSNHIFRLVYSAANTRPTRVLVQLASLE